MKLAIIFFLLFVGQIFASTPDFMIDSTGSGNLSRTDVAELHNNTPEWHSVVTNPPADWYVFSEQMLNIDRVRDVLYIGIITGGLMVVDQQLYDVTQDVRRQSPFVKRLNKYSVAVGDGKYQFAATGGLALYGWIGGDERCLRTASQMAESIIAVGIVVQVLKRITGRESPAASTQNGGMWRFFPNLRQYTKNEPQYYSFPSGHISSTTAALTVINENFPESAGWLRPASYAIIGMVGVGLVGERMHWYSDLLPGIALGYSFGLISAHPKGLKIGQLGSSHPAELSFFPTSNGSFNGFTVALDF
jgi:membrane-associated PAP2 superfamily phosphatase